MSQGQPPQKNNRPRQGSQQPPQGRPMPPRPPQHPMQSSQPEKPQIVYVERGTNPLVMVFKVITFPFVKALQIVMRLLTIIIEQLVRSIVSFVIGVILLVGLVVFVIAYGYALVQVNFDFVAALPEMFRLFSDFFGFVG